MKALGSGWLALLMLLWPGVAPLEAGKRVVVDQAAIIVNNKLITRQEIISVKSLQEKDYRSRLKGAELEEKLKNLDEEIKEKVISNLLLETRAEELEIVVSDKEIEERVRNILQSDSRISQIYTDQTLRELVVNDLLSKRVIQREVNSRILVEEKDVSRLCRENQGDTREIDVGHILLRGDSAQVMEKLLSIRKRLEEGDSFAKLAQQYSEDPSISRNKGRLGFISKGQFVKPFEEKAFSMKVGELSDPVKTKYGYHLIRVYAERHKKVANCEEMDELTRRKFYEQVWNEKRRKNLERYFADLKKNADIKVLYQP